MMKQYILHRLLQLIPVLIGITLLSFACMYLAGSDAVIQKYEQAGIAVSQGVLDSERARLGLDQPFYIQYIEWLYRLLHGDMGQSYVSGQSAAGLLMSKLPATLTLMAASLLLTLCISIPLGVLAAVKQNSLWDYGIRLFSFCGSSIPSFVIALVLLYVFAVQYAWVPVIAVSTTWEALLLPACTLAVVMSAKYIRQVRTAVLEEMSKPYVAGAMARGIPFRYTLYRSILRAASVTLVTLLALSIGSLLGGTAVVETIFMWDGIGKLAVDAIAMRDYPIIQAYVFWMALIYMVVNLAADISYHLLVPAIRWGGSKR